MSILVVGTVAIDSVKTPFGVREKVLGGSATYFSMAASFFNKVNLIAVVGKDFPGNYLKLFEEKKIGTDGLQIMDGKTFRWKGCYEYDLNTAHTIYTHLNVLQKFKPQIPKSLKNSEHIFLANIDPELQHDVLRQVTRPKLVACDSMNYWIEHKRKALEELLPKIDILLLNDAEVRQLTGETNLIKASRAIVRMGPKAVIIKKGEHGAIYFSRNSHFIAPAYLLESIYDPTGAGDTFAGGMVGFLSTVKKINETSLRKSIIYATIMASFTVEDFGVNRLLHVSKKNITARYEQYRRMTKF